MNDSTPPDNVAAQTADCRGAFADLTEAIGMLEITLRVQDDGKYPTFSDTTEGKLFPEMITQLGIARCEVALALVQLGKGTVLSVDGAVNLARASREIVLTMGRRVAKAVRERF